MLIISKFPKASRAAQNALAGCVFEISVTALFTNNNMLSGYLFVTIKTAL